MKCFKSTIYCHKNDQKIKFLKIIWRTLFPYVSLFSSDIDNNLFLISQADRFPTINVKKQFNILHSKSITLRWILSKHFGIL